MNTVILIFLSLFATIGLAFIIDGVMKYLVYDAGSVSDMELSIRLNGDNECITDTLQLIYRETYFMKTKNGRIKIRIIDDGISNNIRRGLNEFIKDNENITYKHTE